MMFLAGWWLIHFKTSEFLLVPKTKKADFNTVKAPQDNTWYSQFNKGKYGASEYIWNTEII